jgi:hypothetical protein
MTQTPPKFFVPDVPAGSNESAWHGDLAAYARQPVPPEDERVYSITYTHSICSSREQQAAEQ